MYVCGEEGDEKTAIRRKFCLIMQSRDITSEIDFKGEIRAIRLSPLDVPSCHERYELGIFKWKLSTGLLSQRILIVGACREICVRTRNKRHDPFSSLFLSLLFSRVEFVTV